MKYTTPSTIILPVLTAQLMQGFTISTGGVISGIGSGDGGDPK